MLSSMLNLMSVQSKIILCGATATYNNWDKKNGIINYEMIIMKRI
jgi:NADPH-dependent curcumin reductase CurA